MKEKLVIYTCLTGSNEDLANPFDRLLSSDTDLDIYMICMSNNTSLKSDIWQIRYFDSYNLPNDKASRLPKTQPNLFFSEVARYSLYIDNTVRFKRLPNSSDLNFGSQPLFRLFQHPGWGTLEDEAFAISYYGYDSINRVLEQMSHYSSVKPIRAISPLSTCTLIFRDHHNQSIIKQGQFWWSHILAFSKRDQLSFDFACIQTGCTLSYIPESIHTNDLIYSPENISLHRKLANFDNSRYDWHIKNSIPHRANPNQFSDSMVFNNIYDQYRRRDRDPLDFYCWLHKSSLGSIINPRRRLSFSIFRFFEEYFDNKSTTMVGMTCPNILNSYAFSNSDFDNSCKAIQAAFRIKELLRFDIPEDYPISSISSQSLDFTSRYVGVIFISGLDFSSKYHLFFQIETENLFNFESVIVLIALSGSFSSNQIVDLEFRLENFLTAQCIQSSLLDSEHDSVDFPLRSRFYLGCFRRPSI